MAEPIEPESEKIHKVLLVDDRPLVIEGLERVLGATDEFEVVGHCLCGTDAVEKAEAKQPDIVVLDIRLGDTTSTELCRRLVGTAPLCSIVLLAPLSELEAIRQCFERGAAGALLRNTEAANLVRSLQLVAEGNLVVDPALLEQLQLDDAFGSESAGKAISLRPREVEVLHLMATGASTDAISQELGLTRNTVRTYIQTTMEKMGAHSRIQAVVIAQQRGLI